MFLIIDLINEEKNLWPLFSDLPILIAISDLVILSLSLIILNTICSLSVRLSFIWTFKWPFVLINSKKKHEVHP